MTNRVLVLLASLLVGPRVLLAQLPGESAFNSRTTFRQEYLEHTYREVAKAITDWTKAVELGDAKRIKEAGGRGPALQPPRGVAGPRSGRGGLAPELLASGFGVRNQPFRF